MLSMPDWMINLLPKKVEQIIINNKKIKKDPKNKKINNSGDNNENMLIQKIDDNDNYSTLNSATQFLNFVDDDNSVININNNIIKKNNNNNKKYNKLGIGTFIKMVKEDNKILYDNYNQDKSTRNIINNYYKKEKLILGEITKINDLYKVIPLKNTKCFMKNACHKDMQYPMYVDILENKMCVKCRCVECWNKIYPCEHIILNNNELKIIIN